MVKPNKLKVNILHLHHPVNIPKLFETAFSIYD
jgi:hypothetical protein